MTNKQKQAAYRRCGLAAKEATILVRWRAGRAVNRWDLHWARQSLARPVPAKTLPERLEDFLVAKYVPVIRERGGEIELVGRTEVSYLHVYDHRNGLTLLGVDGWRQYSRRYGARRAALAYLCGEDDNGKWAARVPSTMTSTIIAELWLTPAPVADARALGQRVVRQGDLYAIEVSPRMDTKESASWGRHHWDPVTRMLTHDDGHAPVHFDYPVRFAQQRPLAMGRIGG